MGPRLFGWNRRDGFVWGPLPPDWRADGVTDYRVSLFPIGGYVKIAGMIDESFDIAAHASPPQPWEFRAKKTWQKVLMVLGGVIMNIVLAYVLLVGIALAVGKTELATRTIAYITRNAPAEQLGFMSGDELVRIGNTEVHSVAEFLQKLAQASYRGDVQITLRRSAVTPQLRSLLPSSATSCHSVQISASFPMACDHSSWGLKRSALQERLD